MANMLKNTIFGCIVTVLSFLFPMVASAQLPNLEQDGAIIPLTSAQIERTFKSREFDGAYPGIVLGKSQYHFDRKFSVKGVISHIEQNFKTVGKWNAKNGKMCLEFDSYIENKCYRVYEMGNCFYFYEERKTDNYLLGREFDRWDTRLVPKKQDGLCRVFIYQKRAGQAPILISPIY